MRGFFCDDFCQWGSKDCPGDSEPPRPDCEVLTCTSSNSTPSPTPPTPVPPSPPTPTPPPGPTPPPTPGPVPPGPPTPSQTPAWKIPVLVVGGVALAILVPALAYYGVLECKHRYGVYKLRERRQIAENVRLQDRLDAERFRREFNRAVEGYVPIDNRPHPDSIEVYMEEQDEADRVREREEAHREAMEQEAAERYRRFHGHEDEPLIRINVRGGAVRMSRIWSDIKDKAKDKGAKIGETAAHSARTVKAKIQQGRQ